MLLSSARRLWRLARPFQEYRGGTSHYRLYARCYSSTISGGGSKLSDRRSSVAFLGGINNGYDNLTKKMRIQSGRKLSTQMAGFLQDVAQFKWYHIYLPSLRQFWKLYGNTDVPWCRRETRPGRRLRGVYDLGPELWQCDMG
ncbi:hypothetical protein PC119_g10844 [Phytophthora cactorum]|uniref:Uncharacterized protein n=1 Tax=Phytophthora cactorum TaxID=29920 RepID=A0A8T1DLS8_9STRA|nr:hypothetical protein PC117_g10116 [Phytophthora cactorum]KAG3017886.1 hypothetical protein PC119_g10844 [Phytophthora cactorum]